MARALYNHYMKLKGALWKVAVWGWAVVVLVGCSEENQTVGHIKLASVLPTDTAVTRVKSSESPTLTPPLTTTVIIPTTSLVTPTVIAPFGPTPKGGQIGGLIGIFIYEDESAGVEPCVREYDVLRFYDDGLVLGVTLCIPGSFVESWPKISKWFHRDSEAELSRGVYQIKYMNFWFQMIGEYSYGDIVIVDYFGTIFGDELILHSYSHYNGNQNRRVFHYISR